MCKKCFTTNGKQQVPECSWCLLLWVFVYVIGAIEVELRGRSSHIIDLDDDDEDGDD